VYREMETLKNIFFKTWSCFYVIEIWRHRALGPSGKEPLASKSTCRYVVLFHRPRWTKSSDRSGLGVGTLFAYAHSINITWGSCNVFQYFFPIAQRGFFIWSSVKGTKFFFQRSRCCKEIYSCPLCIHTFCAPIPKIPLFLF